MKLKYYLRGLGTGIAVTALIIGISAIVSRKTVMTDEEIITRAKELGMVERTVLSEIAEESEEIEEEPEVPPKKESEMKTEEESPESETEEFESEGTETEKSILEEPKVEESILEEPEVEESILEEPETAEFGMPDEAGIVQFSIIRGDSSDSVSRRLEEAGLVDSAVEYDKYLCQNGYDKRIQTGNYDIPANATQEEIAIIITSR